MKKFAQMTRRSFVGMVGAAGLTLAACSGGSEEAAPSETTDEAAAAAPEGSITGTYAVHVQGYDWGCGVDKVTLTLDAPLDGVEATDFAIVEHKQTTDWSDTENFPVIEADVPRTITGATLGEDGKTVEIELACAPNDGDSPLLFTMATQYNTWSDPYYLHISLSEDAAVTSEGNEIPGIDIEQAYTEMTTSADAWTFDEMETSEGVTYKYASWSPEEESKTLFVWLHGMGEGGIEKTDPRVTILANKVVALSEDEFQQTVGGAHIVAPQCPTYWMDSDGKSGNFNGGGIETTADSFYTASLEEFIDSYAEQVGAESIVVGGCSNGGYMTMVLSISRPDAYACVIPICEALTDELITDEQIESLKDLPMYFVFSRDDTTVDPAKHEKPTIKRLRKIGKDHETLHVSVTNHVVDTSGQFTDEEGNPYAYSGHWSWIYFDNNECVCKQDGTKAWDFIAEHVK